MSWDREKERKAGRNMTISSTVFSLLFSIFWCCAVVVMGAWPMLIFGLLFVGMTSYRLYVLLQVAAKDKKKETQKDAEPWERKEHIQPNQPHTFGKGYCPYCGGKMEEGFRFCPQCGRRIE